jgi:uncharacterized membrane protein
VIRLRRETDKGFLCAVALRFSQFWDFIDKRDIDKHVVSLAIFAGTIYVVRWATHYAETVNMTGLEIAAVIAAVMAPYMALQGAAIRFYFDSRTP